MGGSQTVSLPTAGKHGLLLFDAVAGQGLSLQLSGSTFTSCTLYIIAPNGSTVAFANNTQTSSPCTSATTSVSSIPLLTTGTYTIAVDPAGTTGSLTISLVQDASASISIDGPPVTVTTTIAKQDARLTFNVIAGQRIAVYATNVTNNGANVYWVAPDGTVGPTGGLFIHNSPGTTFFMDTQTLTETGQYALWVMHNSNNVGSETLQIASVPPDVNGGTLTVPSAGSTGPAGTMTTTRAGQNGSFAFPVTAGQRLSFNFSNNTYSSCNWDLYDPNSAFVATGGSCSVFVDTTSIHDPLSVTGNYTLLIDPQGSATGSTSVSINNDADVTGTIAIDGSPVTTGTTVAGQDARLSFSATSGQRIVVFETNITNPSQTVFLVTPSGSNQASVGGDHYMDTQSLATTGTYQLWVAHAGTNIGNETLQINSVPADVSGSVTMNGSGFPFTTVAGQNATITFTNPQSQNVTVHWTSGTYPSSPGCLMSVSGHSGSQNCATATGSYNLGTLASGNYTITVDPQRANTGGMTISATSP